MRARQSDMVYKKLENMIISGKFEPDERLDEIKLAKQFNVSRTPVREALLKLAQAGLAEQIPHRGVFISQPSSTKLLEKFEVMAELEAACGRIAAKRISNEGIAQLEVFNESCRKAATSGDTDLYYSENEKFHREIYLQSGNDYLADLALSLHLQLSPFRRIQLRLRGRMEQSLAEHEKIITSLRDGNPEDSAKKLRDHVSVQGEKFMHLMSTFRHDS